MDSQTEFQKFDAVVRKGGWPVFALHQFPQRVPHHCVFFCKASDAAGETFVRSTLPVLYAVVIPAPSTSLRASPRRARVERPLELLLRR